MDSFELTCDFPGSSSLLYYAWLDSEAHSAFTGGTAAIESIMGSRFVAWDGYITGIILELSEGKRILHKWRTNEFPEDAEDSYLEILFEDLNEGCRLTLKHWNIPDGQGDQYKSGWDEHYFQPMLKYFSKL